MTTWCGRLYAVVSMWFVLSTSAVAMNLSESFSFGFEFTLDYDFARLDATTSLDDPIIESAPLGNLTGLDSPTTFSAPAPSVLEAEPTTLPEPVLESEVLVSPTIQVSTQFSSFDIDSEPTFSFRQFTDEAAPTSTSSEPVEIFEPTFSIAGTTEPTSPEPTPDPITTSTTEPPTTFTFAPTFNFLSLNYNFDLEALRLSFAETTTTVTPTTTSPSSAGNEPISEPLITVRLADLEFDAEPETSTSPAPKTTAAQSLSFSSQSAAAISPQQTTSQPETLLTECTTDCPAAGDEVPEPGILLLLGFGIAGIITTRRRHKFQSQP